MPTQELACVVNPAMLLTRKRRGPHAVLLDGAGKDSWGVGQAVYSDAPWSTLEVFATGWGRWCRSGEVRWRRAAPLLQWADFAREVAKCVAQLPEPDAAGLLSVLSYDLKHWGERLVRRHAFPPAPVLFAAFYTWSCLIDYREGRVWVGDQTAAGLRERLRDGWPFGPEHRPESGNAGDSTIRPQPLMTKGEYCHMIEKALDYIAAGDIYQVNLAQPFDVERLPRGPDGARLFAALRDRYPMPFGAYVDGDGWEIVSNSPECFLLVEGDRIATFPIKGTRAREGTGNDDSGGTWGQARCEEPSAQELVRDPKERAEHVMIVDLERNDLGRVCRTGSVVVRELSTLHSYPFLHHMVSRVEGRLVPGASFADVLRATFPGGSVTGAPKIRAMEIIEELEPCPRGFYTGAIGWTDRRGRSRFNLAIRTAVLSASGLRYHAGGGIVADSDPVREYEETLLKSEAFFRALELLP